jgi:hypothetical protein
MEPVGADNSVTPPADVNPDFYHWVGIFSGVMLWPAGLSADTDGFAH